MIETAAGLLTEQTSAVAEQHLDLNEASESTFPSFSQIIDDVIYTILPGFTHLTLKGFKVIPEGTN